MPDSNSKLIFAWIVAFGGMLMAPHLAVSDSPCWLFKWPNSKFQQTTEHIESETVRAERAAEKAILDTQVSTDLARLILKNGFLEHNRTAISQSLQKFALDKSQALDQRRNVVFALGKLGGKETLDFLAKHIDTSIPVLPPLDDKEFQETWAFYTALDSAGWDAIPAVLRRMGDKHSDAALLLYEKILCEKLGDSAALALLNEEIGGSKGTYSLNNIIRIARAIQRRSESKSEPSTSSKRSEESVSASGVDGKSLSNEEKTVLNRREALEIASVILESDFLDRNRNTISKKLQRFALDQSQGENERRTVLYALGKLGGKETLAFLAEHIDTYIPVFLSPTDMEFQKNWAFYAALDSAGQNAIPVVIEQMKSKRSQDALKLSKRILDRLLGHAAARKLLKNELEEASAERHRENLEGILKLYQSR